MATHRACLDSRRLAPYWCDRLRGLLPFLDEWFLSKAHAKDHLDRMKALVASCVEPSTVSHPKRGTQHLHLSEKLSGISA